MKIKLSLGASMPYKKHDTDAGYDLTVISAEIKEENNEVFIVYDTGVAIETPKGYYWQVHERSSCYKKGIKLANSVGIIDSDYRGTIKAVYRIGKSVETNEISYTDSSTGAHITMPFNVFYYYSFDFETGIIKKTHKKILIESIQGYAIGDRVCQIILCRQEDKNLEWELVTDLTVTDRNAEGFGSTGK